VLDCAIIYIYIYIYIFLLIIEHNGVSHLKITVERA